MAAPDPFPPEAAFRLLNQSREVFVIADATGVLRYVSPSAANLFGFKNGARGASRSRAWRARRALARSSRAASRATCIAAADDISLRAAVDVLGKPATLFIHGEDHGALGALCTDAVAHTTSSGTTRLRHRTTAAGQFVPMDCKACFDGEFIFLVRERAHVACRPLVWSAGPAAAAAAVQRACPAAAERRRATGDA